MKIWVLAIFGFLLFLFWTGCATSKNEKWLTFFFDGVPQTTTEVADLTSGFVTQEGAMGYLGEESLYDPRAARLARGSQIWVHEPYASRDCRDCHDSEYSEKLTANPRELCFQCHEDFIQGLAFTHGPVGAGECMTCHEPHKSKQKFGLIRVGQDLCLICHESSDVLLNPEHDDIGDRACEICHDPHQSEEPFLLRLTTTLTSSPEL